MKSPMSATTIRPARPQADQKIRAGALFLVVISARDDHQIVTINTIDKTIGIIDPALPETRQILSKRLGLADPDKRRHAGSQVSPH